MLVTHKNSSSLLESISRVMNRFGSKKIMNYELASDDNIDSVIDSLNASSNIMGDHTGVVSQMRQFYQSREALIQEYDSLDPGDVISSALDQYADSVVSQSASSGELEPYEFIYGSNKATKALNTFLKNNKVDIELWSWSRHIIKYGEMFLVYKIYDDGTQEVMLEKDPNKFIKVRMNNVESIFDTEFAAFVDKDTDGNEDVRKAYAERLNLKDVFVIHTALPSRTEKDKKVEITLHDQKTVTVEHLSGSSILDPILVVARIIRVIEDTLLMSRIEKSRTTRFYEVEVGQSDQKKATETVNKVKSLLGGREVLNTVRNSYEKSSAGKVLSEIVLPVRNGVGAVTVNDVNSVFQAGDMEDLAHFETKFYAGIKIPKTYLGQEDSAPSGLGSDPLAKVEQRYGRAVRRIILAVESALQGIVKIYKDYNTKVGDVIITLSRDRTQEELDKAKNLSDLSDSVKSVITTITENDPSMDPSTVTRKVVEALMPEVYRILYQDDEGNEIETKEEPKEPTTEE